MRRIVLAIAVALLTMGVAKAQELDELSELKAALASPYSIERYRAINEMGQLTDPSVIREGKVVGLLIDVVGDESESPRVRAQALRSLAMISRFTSPSTATTLVMKILDNKRMHPLVRRAAAQTLGSLVKTGTPEGDRALRRLVMILRSKDEPGGMKAAAAHALGRMGTTNPAALDALVESLSTKDRDVQAAVVEAFVSLIGEGAESEAVISALARVIAIKDPDPAILVPAIRATGTAATKGVKIPASTTRNIEGHLTISIFPQVQIACITALGQIRDPKSLDILMSVVGTKKYASAAREKAVYMLEGYVREPGSKGAGTPVGSRATEVVFVAAASGNAKIAAAAAWVLGEIPVRSAHREEAVKALVKLLDHEDKALRENCTRSLESLTGKTFGMQPSLWQAWYDTRTP